MADALLPLRAIDRRVRLLASRLEGPRIVLPTFGQSDHDGRPHIEVGERYAFVVCERGTEFERRTTLDLDELLYWSFQSTTFSMAVDWELAHRIPGEDARRQLFQHQRDLLEVLDPRWAIRRDEELLTVLREHPFADPA
jgi:hypothetical protein